MTILSVNTFFSKVKTVFWPIERHELPFFIPMALLMMGALYNFAALRAIKDSLIVSNIGAESISFLKLWLVLPTAIIFTVIYLKLSNLFSIDKIFYVITSSFLVFFWVFAFIIYPNHSNLHFDPKVVEEYVILYPKLKWFIHIIGKWSYALIYVFAELWSVMVINIMFWQLANQVTKSEDAKRFYPLFGVVGSVGLIIAGNSLIYFSNIATTPKFITSLVSSVSNNDAEVSLKLAITSVIIAGIIMQLIMLYLNKFVIHKLITQNKAQEGNSSESSAPDTGSIAPKLSLLDSIKLILASKYIGYITIIIICYGFTINIVEGPWKDKIRQEYPTQQEYMAFMGHFNIWMGISCVSFMVIGSNILRKFNWLFAALFTPITIGVTGIAFFSFVIFSEHFNEFANQLAFNPIFAAVIAGGMQNILSKSSKYSMFDATKEMAYIPLSVELKVKGKAAAEIIGAKLGKSLGAILQAGMFTLLPDASFHHITPTLMIIFTIVIILWIIDVMKLSKEYNKITVK